MQQNQNERNNGLYSGGEPHSRPAGRFIAVYAFPFAGCWAQFLASGDRDG